MENDEYFTWHIIQSLSSSSTMQFDTIIPLMSSRIRRLETIVVADARNLTSFSVCADQIQNISVKSLGGVLGGVLGGALGGI